MLYFVVKGVEERGGLDLDPTVLDVNNNKKKPVMAKDRIREVKCLLYMQLILAQSWAPHVVMIF